MLHLDRNSGAIVDRSLEHREEIQKRNGEPVRIDPFLDPAYAHISGVLYSSSDGVNRAKQPSDNFTVIYNENADVKLPRGWLHAGEEYWREGNQLHSNRGPE